MDWFTKAFKDVGKAFEDVGKVTVKETIKVVNDINQSSVATDISSVATDVGTSATRIVTDTAIDTANVITGFQFEQDMENAKKTMSGAGVLSAADAIEKNHYGFLKDMEREARTKYEEVQRLYTAGQQVEFQRNLQLNELNEMLMDVDLLAQMTLEAKQLLEKASQVPDWQKWAEMLDITLPSVQQIDSYISKWDQVGLTMSRVSLGTNISAGVLSGLTALRSLAAVSKMSKVSQLAKASKFLKIGKLAGRASAVLSVASIGLDIGLSVAELEERKEKLEQYLSELNQGIAEANQDLTSFRKEVRDIGFRMDQLLQSVSPPQTHDSWDTWVAATKQELDRARTSLVDFQSIRDRAIAVAKMNCGSDYQFRVELLMSVDPDISEEEAKSILTSVDQGLV
jgi:uncharacterized coiled-coil protein SlyX